MGFDRRALELRQRRLGEHVERLAGRIGDQVEVKRFGHVDRCEDKPRESTGDNSGTPNCTRIESFGPAIFGQPATSCTACEERGGDSD